MTEFQDHFGAQARKYSQFRPSYPEQVYTHLAELAPDKTVAWDCATGSGQAALSLLNHFETVLASDASLAQLQHAANHDRLHYFAAGAEHPVLRRHCLSLICVAQALHWFNHEQFYQLVAQYLKPDGILAVVAYGHARIADSVDAVVRRYYADIVGPFWPPQTRHIEDSYKSILPPWPLLNTPTLSIQVRMSCKQFIGYLGSWSATRYYAEHFKRNPLALIDEDLTNAWGKSRIRTVEWPLTLILTRNPK